MKTRIIGLLLALGVATTSIGCGGASAGLTANFPDDRPSDVEAVLSRLAAAGPRVDADVLVGLTPAPTRLWSWDLAVGRARWEVPVETSAMPHVAGRYIALQEGDGVVVRRLEDGGVAARLETRGLGLVGADGEGDVVAIALSTGGGVGARSKLVVLRGGSVAWQLELEQTLGVPAVRAGMVFLPWAAQNVSTLDARTGEELARVRSTGVVGHAFAEGSSVFFGQRELAQLDARTHRSMRAALDRELPGAPQYLRDAYQSAPSATSATHRVRLAFRVEPGADGTPRMTGDTVYLVFYRLVFALDAERDVVRWAATLPSDVVGADVSEAGLWVTDQDGRVFGLSPADGHVTAVAETGLAATWAFVSRSASAAAGANAPLRDQLLAVVQDTDARLVPARAFAARAMAALPEGEATLNLIALCEDDRLPAPIRSASCEALGARTTGTEHVLRALERHASHLRGTSIPPVGALARAAANAGERRAVPLLLAHLRDPHTPSADLAPLADALRVLGDHAATEPLDAFVRLYHAEPVQSGVSDGLRAAVQAYATLAGPTARPTLELLLGDPSTDPAVREVAGAALRALDAPAEETPAASDEPG